MVQRFYVKDGQEVKAGTKLLEWDPHNNSIILLKKKVYVKYIDLINNITSQEEYDEAAR